MKVHDCIYVDRGVPSTEWIVSFVNCVCKGTLELRDTLSRGELEVCSWLSDDAAKNKAHADETRKSKTPP